MSLTKVTYSMIEGALTNVDDFGAAGDGVTDDTASVQAALDAVSDKGVVLFGEGKTYLISSQLTASKPNKIDLNGSTLIAASTIDSAVLSYQSAVKATYTGLSLSVSQADVKFTIPGSVSLAVGDLVKFTSTDVYLQYLSEAEYFYGQYAVITKIVGGEAFVSTPFFAAFTVTGMTVYTGKDAMTLCNGRIDVSARAASANSSGGAVVRGTNIVVDQMTLKGNSYVSQLLIVSGEVATVQNCHIYNANVQGGGLGYGINSSANNTLVSNCVINDCKHGFTAADRSVMTIGIAIRDTSIYESGQAGDSYTGSIDTHVNVWGKVVIDRCRVIAKGRVVNKRCDSDWTISNCFFRSIDAAPMIGGYEQPVKNLTVKDSVLNQQSTGTTICGFGNGVTAYEGIAFDRCLINSFALMFLTGIDVDDLSCTNSTFNGTVFLHINNGSLDNANIKDNYLNTDRVLFYVHPDGTAFSNINIENNTVVRDTGSNDHVVHIFNAVSESTSSIARNLKIIGNNIRFPAGDASTLAYGIYINGLDARFVAIQNNIISRGNTVRGIAALNVLLNAANISGNNMDSSFFMIADDATVTLVNTTVFGNTGVLWELQGTGTGTFNKTRYKFSTDSNNFDTVTDPF